MSEFGDLLTKGLRSIAANENRAIGDVETELAEELQMSPWSIRKWRGDRVPKKREIIAHLAAACVHRGEMDRQWLTRFLAQANYKDSNSLDQQLFRTNTLASSISDLDSSSYHVEHATEQKGRLDSSARPKGVIHNLPWPDYESFVGREVELKEIFRLLLPSRRHFVITIDGIGGIGKSALALEVAHTYLREHDRLPSEERFEAIIWTSAKQSVLTIDGIAARRHSLHSLQDIYSAIAIALGREDITSSRPEEIDELVRHVLTQQRTLLIVDNLETVDDDQIWDFIREIPAPTKVIITTRHWLDIAYPLRLVEMGEDEGIILVKNEAKRKNVKLSEAEVRQLYMRTGGVPLAIVLSVAQMGAGVRVAEVLSRLAQSATDLTRFCFEGSIERIRGKHAHDLLMALSLFATDASRSALGYVTGLAEFDRDDGLVDLEKLSLVNKSGGRFRALALTLVYVRSELAKLPETEVLYRSRWLEYLLDILGEPRKLHYDELGEVTPEIGNIISAMDYCWATGRLETLVDFAERIEFYFRVTGNWTAWKEYTELGIKAAEELGAEIAQANLLYSLAMVLDNLGSSDQARDLLRRAFSIYQNHGDKEGMALCLWWLGGMQKNNEGSQTARETLNRALTLAEQLPTRNLVSRIQRQLALCDVIDGNPESADARLKQAIAELPQRQSQPTLGLAYIYVSLAQVALLRKDYDAASTYFRRSLDVAGMIKRPVAVAIVKLYSAELELNRGNIDQGRKLAKEAVEMFARLGMKEDLLRTNEVLEDLLG